MAANSHHAPDAGIGGSRHIERTNSTMTDEEYEAELQARTPEEWAAMAEKAEADEKDVFALRHLWWRKDAKSFTYLAELAAKPDKTIGDRDYVLRQIGEIADRLRDARDNPERRERQRWKDLLFAAAMIGSSNEARGQIWLQQAQDCFPAVRGPEPGKDAPLLAQATYAVESLLDALLMKPEERAELEGKMSSWFLQWAGENGVRAGTFHNGKFEQYGRIIPFKPGDTPGNSMGPPTSPGDPPAA
jgi:hypothetical protein